MMGQKDVTSFFKRADKVNPEESQTPSDEDFFNDFMLPDD